MKINITIQPPAPTKKIPMIQRVRHARDCIESGADGERAWQFLKKLHTHLTTKFQACGQLPPEELELMHEMKEVILKHALSDICGLPQDEELMAIVARYEQNKDKDYA